MNEFMRKQYPHESGATFVTRITNLRPSLGREGTNISTVQFKSTLLEGLRQEYQTAIAFLRITELDNDDLSYELTSICNSVDKQLALSAKKEHNSAHYGSLNDAFGY